MILTYIEKTRIKRNRHASKIPKRAKAMVMQEKYRTRKTRDTTKYSRKVKHKALTG